MFPPLVRAETYHTLDGGTRLATFEPGPGGDDVSTVHTGDGTEIHYEISGGGDLALVFVHGWCSNLRHWDAQVAHFSERYRTVAVDRRGHGRSEVATDGYDAPTHAADVAAVMEVGTISEAVVVGHAGGGPATLALAGSRPELVRAIVLVDAIISPASTVGDPDDRAGSALGAMIDRLRQSDGEAALAEIYRGFFTDRAGAAGEQAVADACRTPLTVAAEELRSLAVDTVALARQVAQPVLWLSAAPADQDRLRGLFHEVHFAEVADAGHFPHIEAPAAVDAAIEDFLGSVGLR